MDESTFQYSHTTFQLKLSFRFQTYLQLKDN